MRQEINLLSSIQKSKRNVALRQNSKSDENIRIAREYGEMYFDGPREFGYGGYLDDGRWKGVAVDIVEHFKLRKGDKLLDVGAAKGFLVYELVELGIDAIGIDISKYALEHCKPEIASRMNQGSADNLPFLDGSFQCVISLDTIHNLDRNQAKVALQEIQRLSGGRSYVKVDSYHTPEQKEIFESWVLTAKFHDYPSGWLQLFDEASYTGDYFWTIIE